MITDDPVALNQWIAVAYAGQVTATTPRVTQILGQEVRLALVDGELSCTTPEGRALPVVEKFQLVFSTLGDDPRPLPLIPEFDEPDRRLVNCGGVGVNACPARIVENFLDMAHFCFVHTDILGAVDQTEVYSYKAEHRTDVDEVWATECRFFQPAASRSAADQAKGQITEYEYRVMSPFSVMLYKTAPFFDNRLDAICLFVQPHTETSCTVYPPMALLDAASTDAAMVEFQQTVFLQDRIILENQYPKLMPLTPRTEIPTRADLSSMAFRRWLKDSGMRFGLAREAAA